MACVLGCRMACVLGWGMVCVLGYRMMCIGLPYDMCIGLAYDMCIGLGYGKCIGLLDTSIEFGVDDSITHLLITNILSVHRDRFLHGSQTENLEQMIL